MLLDQDTLLVTRVDYIKHLIEVDGDLCYLCGKPFTKSGPDDWEDYTIDHVIPRSRGGLDHIDNYKLAHFPCNQEKDDRLFLEDGTLEPKRRSGRVQKTERPELCQNCWNGRRLQKDAVCHVCNCEAGPIRWPWYAKRSAMECDHDATWCWMCGSGVIIRDNKYPVV